MGRELKVAIIGKTNVGKSTLLNSIVRKKIAIQHDRPGVTRDRQDVKFELGTSKLVLTDTAGLEYFGKVDKLSRHVTAHVDAVESQKDAEMYKSMMAQTLMAADSADCMLFVVDGVNGITEEDLHFGGVIRGKNKPVLLVVNKCESDKRVTVREWDLFKFGIKRVAHVSAEHRLGFDDIYKFFWDCADALGAEDGVDGVADGRYHEKSASINIEDGNGYSGSHVDSLAHDISIAIIGRPNVGKSTLVNSILGEDRMIVGDKSGITRDSVAVSKSILNKNFRIIDTAGVRKSNNQDALEKISVSESIRALRLCQVAIVLLDATEFFVKQELAIIGDAIAEGRGVVIAINKWDKIISEVKRKEISRAISNHTESMFSGLFSPNITTISALNKNGLEGLMRLVLKMHENWSSKVQTRALNGWLAARVSRNPPKRYRGKETKIKYISQIKIRPPTFAIFTNHPEAINNSYLRYLSNSISKDFGLLGIPIRISVRKSSSRPPLKRSGDKSRSARASHSRKS